MLKNTNIGFLTWLVYLTIIVISVFHQANTNSIVDVASEECKNKVLDGMKICQKRSQDKWQSQYLSIKREKWRCCMGYDTSDCFEQLVKDKCSNSDFEKVHQDYMKLNEPVYGDGCANYEYYSSKCIILADEIEKGTPEEEKKKLLAELNAKDDSCPNEITKQNCTEKAALKLGVNSTVLDDLKATEQIKCCANWLILDCSIDASKKINICNRQNVLGIIQMKEKNIKDTDKLHCSKYPYGSDLCPGHTNQCDSSSSLASLSRNVLFISVFKMLLHLLTD